MTDILWTPVHEPTEDQIAELNERFAGHQIIKLKELEPELFANLKDAPSDWYELKALAVQLGDIAEGFYKVILPISSPAFMYVFASQASLEVDQNVLFAHSERVSIEEPQADGSVIKKSVFKHVKFFGA